jgi:serine/threonine protein kinase
VSEELELDLSRIWRGRVLAGCRLDERIGQGGFANAMRGVRLSDGLPVVLKVVRHRPERERHERRLLREGRLLASLDHPGIVPCLDAGWTEGFAYLVMPWLDVRTARELLAEGPLSLPRATHLVAQLLEALAHVHARGLVHRDVKPSNLLVGPDDRCLLSDFGLAVRVDEPHRGGAGTAGYRAPEQESHEPARIDGRADLWSVGVTLHVLLTDRHVADPAAVDPALPPPIRAWIARLLAPDPRDRFASGQAALAELRHAT